MRQAFPRPSRKQGLINLAIAVAALMVIIPLLLNAAQSSPPTAAEFAPVAQQVIKQAPPGQAAQVNGGGSPGAGVVASPSPQLQVPENLVKNCVGPPPLRQIEDPQSPPCVPFWQGDNGGATAVGVTREKIYVVVPTPNGFTQEYAALANFFNKRFEFYGRKVVFQYCTPVAGSGSQGSGDQPNQQSDAAQASSGCPEVQGNPSTGIKPFASTFYQFDNGRYYNYQMSCRYGILTVASYTSYDSRYLDGCPGRLLQYPMVTDEMFGQVGTWACARLAGRIAQWSAGTAGTGGPNLNTVTRKFGIFLAPYYQDDPIARKDALSPLLDALNGCGVHIPDSQIIINPVQSPTAGQATDPVSANNAITQMRQQNVTSIFCFCGIFNYGALTRAADSQSYTPEWIASSYGILDDQIGLNLAAAPPDQLAHQFGLTFLPRHVNPVLEPYNLAFQEGDPTIGEKGSSFYWSNFTQVYRPLLVLMSGIQMAGPHLTHETLVAALRRTVFPNPITSLQAGAVDVPSNGYSFTHDAAEYWWNNNARGPYTDDTNGKGTYCYLDGGVRRRDAWPHATPNFFPASGACDSGS